MFFLPFSPIFTKTPKSTLKICFHTRFPHLKTQAYEYVRCNPSEIAFHCHEKCSSMQLHVRVNSNSLRGSLVLSLLDFGKKRTRIYVHSWSLQYIDSTFDLQILVEEILEGNITFVKKKWWHDSLIPLLHCIFKEGSYFLY